MKLSCFPAEAWKHLGFSRNPEKEPAIGHVPGRPAQHLTTKEARKQGKSEGSIAGHNRPSLELYTLINNPTESVSFIIHSKYFCVGTGDTIVNI